MQTNHFLTLLAAELKSCEEDVHDLEKLCHDRFQAREITNYVHMENDALLKQEASGIGSIRKELESLDHDSYASIDEAYAAVVSLVEQTVKQRQLPRAIIPLVTRRAERLRDFVLLD